MSSAPGIAVPGSSVPASSPVAPGGAQGIQGIQGAKGPPPYTVTTADFTMPAPGSTVIVNVQDASWVIVGEMLTVQTAGGNPTTAASLRCTAKSGNQLTLLYQPPTTIPLASTTQAGLLGPISGNSTDYVGGDNIPHDLGGVITAVRLRSFNAVGNPNFEVNQRMGGTSSLPVGSTWPADRWLVYNATGTTGIFCSCSNGQVILLPGTNFTLTQGQVYFNIQSASKPSLAATDQLILTQYIEGPAFRELQSDVHSLSILAQTNIPGGLKFSLILQDAAAAYTLAKLCTIPAPNVPTLIQLPNLPIWSSSATWSNQAGQYAYNLIISLCAGSSQIAPANDVWVSGNFRGAIGMDNLLAKPASSIVQFWFVQHEPGPRCTTLIDKPFSQNLDECLRYYQKTYPYSVAPGTANQQSGELAMWLPVATTSIFTGTRFFKPLASGPSSLIIYSPITGAPNSYAYNGAGATGVTGLLAPGPTGYAGFGSGGAPAAGAYLYWHHTADTGW